MCLLGATAIEDKLQIGVPQTIETLLKAQIKIWILTGDKIETAVNIGYSCRLLQEKTSLIYLTNKDNLNDLLEQHCNSLNSLNDGDRLIDIGLIIDANVLSTLLLPDNCENFIRLALICRTVICCRATPKNKAELVELIKNRTKEITLAVGDGANDVSMIQAAHVGIGIYGREGTQALSASDYAIGQFCFLQKLLLVHGIWNYKRLCKVILYSFYKNVCLYVIELWFAFSNAFSGQVVFDRWLIALYNVLFTAVPPLVLGLFDRPLKSKTMLEYPQLYKYTQNKKDFNVKIFWAWILNSCLHSLLLYFVCLGYLKQDVAFNDGTHGDYLFMGNHIYTYCIIVVCLKCGIESESWTWLTHLSIWGSILFWFIFAQIYSVTWQLNLGIGADMSSMAFNLYRSSLFWLGLLFVPVVTLLPDIIYKALQRTLFKTLEQTVQEYDKANLDPDIVINRYNSFGETTRLLKSVFSFSKLSNKFKPYSK